MTVSNEQPPVRKVIPYKSGKRPSTFRRLNIDFAGTALEEALNQQEQREQETDQEETGHEVAQIETAEAEKIEDHSPPLPTSHHHSSASNPDDSVAEKMEANLNQQYTLLSQISNIIKEESPPVTTTPQREKKAGRESIAPERDFNRRANSLERDALPSGLFPGSTKKVYDALYLRTLGAIVPVKRVRASRRDLLTWTGIRNLKTIDNHIRYLMARGLIIRHWELGSNEGSSYEVRLPEEVDDQYPPLPTSGGESPPLTTTQKMGIPTTQKMGSGGECQPIENTGTYAAPNTIKTKDINTDDDEAFAGFVERMRETVREVTGKAPARFEKDRWRELAELLSAELKIAAGRTTVSSVPSFLVEHLRRRLWKKERHQIEAEAAEGTASAQAAKIDASKCPDCFGAGMYYPQGFDKGVARCTHSRLSVENPG